MHCAFNNLEPNLHFGFLLNLAFWISIKFFMDLEIETNCLQSWETMSVSLLKYWKGNIERHLKGEITTLEHSRTHSLVGLQLEDYRLYRYVYGFSLTCLLDIFLVLSYGWYLDFDFLFKIFLDRSLLIFKKEVHLRVKMLINWAKIVWLKFQVMLLGLNVAFAFGLIFYFRKLCLY